MKDISPALVLTVLIVLIAALAACGDDETTAPPQSDYLALTSPENLVENLETAYQQENIEEYAKLLAPEFQFFFQSVDATEIGLDFWNKTQDSTGTDALFRTSLVSQIRIQLTHLGAQAPTEPGFDPGTLKIRVNPTFLEVDQTDGITWQVDGDIQDMYFRKGREAAGEDTTRWYLFEWRDISGFAPAQQQALAVTQNVTWGKIKNQYTNGEAPGLSSAAIEGSTWGGIKAKYEIN